MSARTNPNAPHNQAFNLKTHARTTKKSWWVKYRASR